ncbi:MIT domain-containing protein 1 [Caligus rogercresseyi]|uniref:MIT domain-containing protein 1 n=1 Tax=Caligus rogercresseyi TaxID=217165 RepID=A0A7T8GW74_CALRO|nr:MIT domain-containing protein 1 [Caligus rogercresseyi]
MLVKHSSDSLESIQLITRMYNDDTELQKSRFMEIKASLAQRGIEFYFVFSNTLHDREFYFDNGWLIKIGRGLDFYQSTQGQFQIGGMDLSMRPCMETTVDIFQCRI